MASEDEPDLTPELLTDLAHLASAVGHHVINAYSTIVSNAEILRITSRSGMAVDPIAIADMVILTAVDASSVARRLIDFTRPVTAIGTKAVALDRLIAEIVGEHQAGGATGVSFVAEPGPVPTFRGHIPQIRAMIGHLVRNAEEALAPQGGSITLATEVDDRGWVSLEIRDTGPGLSPEIQQKAVEPFFTTKHGHMGVGLSVANGIWRRHRGTMAIRAVVGEGTTIRLCVDPVEGGLLARF